VSNVDTRHEIKFKNKIKLRHNAYPQNIRSIVSISISVHTRKLLSVSIRIADNRKISIHGYISVHLWHLAHYFTKTTDMIIAK